MSVEESPSSKIAYEPSAEAAVTVPSVVEVFGGRPVEAWLARDVAGGLAMATPWAIAAAIGTAMRLRKPPSECDIDDLLDEAHTISVGVRWISDNPGVMELLALRARHEADMLIDGLDPLAETIVGCDDGSSAEAVCWARGRDDLESVSELLSCCGGNIKALLAEVDREAGIRQEMWAFMSKVEDRRLLAVSRCEPSAWWGQIAEGSV